MSNMNYLCPQCRSTLASVREDRLDTWQCKEGHGIGLTLSESYGHFQEDEIDAIWKEAKSGARSSLKSPLLGGPMVAITVSVDDDEIRGNQGPGSRLVTLDVAPDEQFLWFHVVDFNNMPADLPNPLPSAEELAHHELLARQSRESIAKDLASREGDLDNLGHRIGSRAAALLGMSGLVKRLSDAASTRVEKA